MPRKFNFSCGWQCGSRYGFTTANLLLQKTEISRTPDQELSPLDTKPLSLTKSIEQTHYMGERSRILDDQKYAIQIHF